VFLEYWEYTECAEISISPSFQDKKPLSMTTSLNLFLSRNFEIDLFLDFFF